MIEKSILVGYLIAAIVGVFITIVFGEFILPKISIYIVHRKHLLKSEFKLDPTKDAKGDPNVYRLVSFSLNNIDKNYSVEDVSIKIYFPNKVEKCDITNDDDVFGYEIGKGMSPSLIEVGTVNSHSIPTCYRNIKVEKMFPNALLNVNVFLNTNDDGLVLNFNGIPEDDLHYTVDYSYKFWGATVRRTIKHSS